MCARFASVEQCCGALRGCEGGGVASRDGELVWCSATGRRAAEPMSALCVFGGSAGGAVTTSRPLRRNVAGRMTASSDFGGTGGKPMTASHASRQSPGKALKASCKLSGTRRGHTTASLESRRSSRRRMTTSSEFSSPGQVIITRHNSLAIRHLQSKPGAFPSFES